MYLFYTMASRVLKAESIEPVKIVQITREYGQ